MIQPFPQFWNSGVTNCVAFSFGRGVPRERNVALKKNSAAGIIEFDWQPSWIWTDLLESKLFPKYFIKIYHPKTYV